MYLEIVVEEARRNEWDKILGFDYAGQAVGCSAAEISKLEADANLNLPVAYKEFLLWAGNGLGDFAIGSDIFYEDADLVGMQQDARGILIENIFPHELPDDAFVFWMHQGYMFSFFRASEGGNPPIRNYREGENDGRILYNKEENFVAFVRDEIKYQASCYNEAARIEERIQRDWTRS